jgi:hypothetical protein
MTMQYCGGNVRQAEPVCGGGRPTGARGLAARRTGLLCLGAQAPGSGRPRGEAPQPPVAAALRQQAAAHAQQAPTLRPSLAYTRLTAKGAWEGRRAPGARDAPLPAPSTMAAVLTRLGLRLRKVVKAKPPQQLKAPDAIVANIKNRMPTPRQRAGANACASSVKRRDPGGSVRAAV